MNILIFALLSDKKLLSKIEPISANDKVKKIFIIRKFPISGEKIVCFSPPRFLTYSNILVEFYRLAVGICISIIYKPKYIIGIYYFFHSVIAGIISFLFKRKLILLVVENPRLYDGNKRYFKLLKRCYKIGVRGSNSKKYLESKNIEKNKIFIPHNVFEFDPNKKDQEILYDLIFIGTLNSDKRPDFFIDIVAAVKKTIPKISCIIIGDGKLKRQIFKQIKSLSLEKNIQVLGYRKNVAEYISKSKLLVMTSQTEGMPMVILEAMNFGIPCVVPDVGDITDVAINDYNSMVIKDLKIEHFSDVIVNCINDQILYKKLSNNSLKTIADNKEKYSIKSIAKEWKKVIK